MMNKKARMWVPNIKNLSCFYLPATRHRRVGQSKLRQDRCIARVTRKCMDMEFFNEMTRRFRTDGDFRAPT